MDLHSRMRNRLATRLQARHWYTIRAADDGTAVVRIYDEIGYWGITAADFARELAAISAERIQVEINSPGGDVFDGIAIYNALRLHPATIVTRVDGLAASAASVILQAGDQRIVVQAGQVMIHQTWGLAIGNAAEMREFADLLDQQDDVLAHIYATRAGDPDRVDEFRAWMAAETWLTDQAAVDLGLADEVLVPDPKATTPARPTATTPAAPSQPPAPATPSGSPVDDKVDDILGRFGCRELSKS